MFERDKKRFFALLAAVSVATSRLDITTAIADVYFTALEDMDFQDVDRAAGSLIRTWTMNTFPPPAAWREAIQGKIEIRAQLALKLACSKADSYNSVAFEDRAIMAAIETVFGSWHEFCQIARITEQNEFVFYENKFIAAYKSAIASSQEPREPYFAGIFEQDNSAYPRFIPPVKYYFLDGTSKATPQAQLREGKRPQRELQQRSQLKLIGK